MGLACAWALARRDIPVTVLERFGHIHDRGSHSGHTRIIRHAYHEGASYVSLVQQADAAWIALGQRCGQPLLRRTGVLLWGPPEDQELQAAQATAQACGLPVEMLAAAEVRRRWPFELPDTWQACLDRSGGSLRVELCLEALAGEARAAGANLRHGVEVVAIESGSSPAVVLQGGTRLTADRVVVAAGAWLPRLLPGLLPQRLTPLRRWLAWMAPKRAHRAVLGRIPVWCAYLSRGFFYGFPYGEEGVEGLKIAVHHADTMPWLRGQVDPDAPSAETLRDAELDAMTDVLRRYLPSGLGPVTATKSCLYTQTSTGDFVVDRWSEDPRIVVAGGFSGHGFKFAPAIGTHVAALLLDDAPAHPEFSIARHHAIAPA